MSGAVLRHSQRDASLIALAAVHGALLIAVPSAPLIAVALWWNANTIAHNFIHLPFFRSRATNVLFSAYLSLLLGLPQTLWRDRHLAHHAERPWRLRRSRRLAFEFSVVAGLWIFVAAQGTAFFFGTWLLGWLGGLALCQIQGHFEHARGTTSHYGAFYNFALFNDGYHVEHHARPGLHWSRLPDNMAAQAERSRWPAVLRWLELAPLDLLERIVTRSPRLQRFVVDRHARAFRQLLAELPPIRRIAIVGGGLFPRTALVLQQVAPDAEITIIDRSAKNIRSARSYIDGAVRWVEAMYERTLCDGADLLVVPLAFDGNRSSIYTDPPAPAVLIHDWIWRRRGPGVVVSVPLLKRLNLVRR